MPLADGPIGMMNNEDTSYCSDKSEAMFEAVALDCSFAKSGNVRTGSAQVGVVRNDALRKASGDESVVVKAVLNDLQKNVGAIMSSGEDETKNDFVLIILAGLTGGSEEGYVLDLVDAANEKGSCARELM